MAKSNRKLGVFTAGFVTTLLVFYVICICYKKNHVVKQFSSNNEGQVVQVVRKKDDNKMVTSEAATAKATATNESPAATTTATLNDDDDDTISFSNSTAKVTGTGTGRPKLILHLGPPKTSTTTIQCSLGQIQELLNKDNYYYIGAFHNYCSYGNMNKFANHTLLRHFHYHDFFVCLRHGDNRCGETREQREEHFKEFQATFDYHLQLGHNLIFSSEHLSKLPWSKHPETVEKLMKLVGDGFDVEVVFTYRDYFAFFLSTYTQNYRNLFIAKRAVRYPKLGSTLTPSFPKALDGFFGTNDPRYKEEAFNEDVWENVSYLDENLNREELFNLKYFRMEQDNDRGLMTNFVCQMIPGATHACSHYKEEDEKHREVGAGDTNKENTSSMDNEVEADQLATALHQRGWINGTAPGCERIPIQGKLRPFLNDMKAAGSSSYPLECPNENRLDELLLKSQEILNQVGKWFEEEERKSMEDLMNKKWSDYIERKKFCTLDYDSFIIDKENEIKAHIEKISCSPMK